MFAFKQVHQQKVNAKLRIQPQSGMIRSASLPQQRAHQIPNLAFRCQLVVPLQRALRGNPYPRLSRKYARETGFSYRLSAK